MTDKTRYKAPQGMGRRKTVFYDLSHFKKGPPVITRKTK
jgi:hypothetical protein